MFDGMNENNINEPTQLYNKIITDNIKLDDHLQLIELLKNSSYIDDEILKLSDKNYNSPLY